MSTQSFVADDIIPITPSDTTVYRAGVVKCTLAAGTLVVKTYKGNTRTTSISLGETLPCLVTQVLAATTATGLELYTAV